MKARFRMRHLRGHGIHSPFVYSLIREAFMKRKLTDGGDTGLYSELIKYGAGKHSARELQNLHSYCKYKEHVIIAGSDAGIKTGSLNIIFPGSDAFDIISGGFGEPAAIVVMYPYTDSAQRKLCAQLIARKECASVDRRKYMVFFYDNKLQVQHFKL